MRSWPGTTCPAGSSTQAEEACAICDALLRAVAALAAGRAREALDALPTYRLIPELDAQLARAKQGLTR